MDIRIDCTHLPECEIGDNGCAEILWTWKEYCSERDTGPVLDTPPLEALVVEPPMVHIPVDTGGAYDAFIFTGWLMMIFGSGFLLVGLGILLRRARGTK